MDSLKQLACDAIDREAEKLDQLSKEIWHLNELGLSEYKSHSTLTQFLEDHGFRVERSYKMETAFIARYGNSSDTVGSGRLPHIAFLCEYDALPEIGHACGHNLIAQLGVAAGLGMKAALDKKPFLGQISIIGTPAEETSGGKIDLLDAGVFDDVDVAMMAHPAPFNDVRPIFIACSDLAVLYKGKPSHAAGFPWEGVNALDGAVLAYVNIATLRQQMKPTWRVHTIFTKSGVKTNIIPEEAELLVSMRAPNDSEHDELVDKITRCARAAADASGCTIEIRPNSSLFRSMVTNEALASLYESNAKMIGCEIHEPVTKEVLGSTDMGNVSHVIPSLHPCYEIGTSAFNHTREFAHAAVSPAAQGPTLQQGKILAMVALDILQDPKLLKTIRENFDKQLKE